ncbi:alkaline phosphatase 4 isoform X2 [Eurosta solidaginis]|uniref:alkaline phosphatase 4 isoform X2 n=1 Tax=Eurosta solidaginis TaxID=178769 RepID=UPI003530FAF5
MEKIKSTTTTARYLQFSTARIFGLATTILLTLMVTVLCIAILVRYEVDSEVSSIEDIPYWKDKVPAEQQLWFDEAIKELKLALNKNWQKHLARNAIIFVTSGIDTESMAAARALLSNRTKPQTALSWEKFPHLGRLRNSCSNTDLCDQFTVASAIFNGVRTKFRLGGLDARVAFRDCRAATNVSHHIKSIIEQAQEIGLRTGFVTTRRVTGATMAALYAHTPNTAWECDTTLPLPAAAAGCLDTAVQLIKSKTAQNFNVIMGGGRQTLVSHVPNTVWDPVDETVCDSQDNRDIMRDWQTINLKLKREFAVLQNNEELQEFNGTAVDHVMGIFANNYIPLMDNGRAVPKRHRTPKLSHLFEKALDVLKRKDRGYLLIVETGVESTASSDDQTRTLLQLNNVVQQLVEQHSDDESLILALFTNGFYVRDAFDSSSEVDVTANEIEFENENEIVNAKRLLELPTEALVYAKGPRAYLLHGVHEETYMSHVLSYALEMGYFNRRAANKQK